VDKLDELLQTYENIDNTPGDSNDRMHTVIQNAVHLASQIKGGVHVSLGSVGQWLDKSHQQLDHEDTMLQELVETYSDVWDRCTVCP
jgi:hypothetical protein